MEMELEPRVKPLSYKVKATSRESPSQKALHVLDTDLRNHWSTGTNTKEWILLELDEPCLLSHMRIYNKSVLEWEIAVGLRYKPETFTKVRPRCEAPRRDMMYHMNYTPCRYVRISCLRGNPIAIFFIQLIGVPVSGLEPAFQPVVNHLLPQIIAHKQDPDDMHLKLLQNITNKLLIFLPQLEADLISFSDSPESNLRFLAMLAGPFYPILHVVNERESIKSASNLLESEVSKSNQTSSALTVSSNFAPRRSRNTSSLLLTSGIIAFRPDVVFVLLRKAYEDSHLGIICRAACRILQKIVEPYVGQEISTSFSSETSDVDGAKPVSENPFSSDDYSSLFGEEFRVPEEHWDSSYLNILDISAVEEGILHVLYACASQPLLCGKLAENSTELWSALPLMQALLPALRPLANSHDNIDESFSPWKQPYIQQALSQIVMTTSSSLYHPLLHAAAGYLSSYSQSHVKAACLLIDLCSNILAPWMPQAIAKVDLALELLVELQATIQNAHHSLARARAAIKYILLALSGHMDDILEKYKEVKQKILFLLEMLEPFLDPAITTFRSTIAFGDVCSNFLEKQEYNCEIALNVIRIAVRKPAVLPYLESEWRSGSVAPSVLLSILEPHLQLPPEIDRCKPPFSSNSLAESSQHTPAASRTNGQDDHDGRTDTADAVNRMEFCEDVSVFFSPLELRISPLTNVSSIPDENASNTSSADFNSEHKRTSKSQLEKNVVVDTDFTAEYFNLQMDYFQLANFRDCELRASEFQRLASDLQLQPQITPEGHDASIDALLLAAECYINPYFMKSSRSNLKDIEYVTRVKIPVYTGTSELRSSSNIGGMDNVAHVEMRRDKIVLQLLIKAAELDRNYRERKISDDEHHGEHAVVFDRHTVNFSSFDIQSADAITLVRQNQALLCNFLIRRLQKGQHSMHEILMQSLLFLLTSATRLSCNPGDVVDIILHSAEYLHELITSLTCNLKDNNMQSSSERKHEIQRRWMLIQKLIIASSGDDDGSDFKINVYDGVRYISLVPASVWIERIPVFFVSASPLVRFVGWMAVSRNAKQYIRDRLFLATELSELTNLLFIFADDLSLREKVLNQKEVDLNIDNSRVKQDSLSGRGLEIADQQHGYQSFDVVYPDIARFFPNMKKQFESFGDNILQAVGLQLRSIPSSMLSDILIWFSDLCLWPFPPKSLNSSPISFNNAKGYMAKNAKAVILFVLEAIVIEHMEAMVPEIPRLVHVLASLCRASHCDVAFLGSVLQLLKPILSYSLKKAAEEDLLTADLCLNFESLCFNELFNSIRVKGDNQLDSSVELYRKPLIIFILASVFSDLSFQRKRELLDSLLFLADFTVSEQTSLYHDYLCAYQCAMDSFKSLMLQILRMFSIIPIQSSAYSGFDAPFSDDTSKSDSWFLCDASSTERLDDASKEPGYFHDHVSIPNEKANHLSADETKALIEDIENLIIKLNPTMEKCWMLHPQLTKKLVISSAECFVYIRCISSVLHDVHNTSKGDDAESPKSDKSSDQLLVHCWQIGLQSLGENMLALQRSHCWIVSSIMLDCLLAVPRCLIKNTSSSPICSAIAGFSCSAPKFSWRLRADKWLSQLFARGIYGFHESEIPLVELFCTLLGHDEPEQRLIALKHLGKVVGQDVVGEQVLEYSESCRRLLSPNFASKIPGPILSSLVNGTWDNMTVIASSDSSFLLRTRAMTVLVDFIPLANRHHLQSFLASANTLLHSLGNFAPPMFEGPYLQLSVALIAGCCLYLPKEDISLIPEDLWNIIESLGSSKPENEVRDVGKKICNALCTLRNEGNIQEEVLRFALSSSNWNHSDPHFSGTREAILQVLANLTSAESYFDAFSGEFDEALEQEEAEIELEIIQNEHAPGEQFRSLKASGQMGSSGDGHLAAPVKDPNRLEQIKNCIQSIEKSRLREEVAARRQKVLLMRHARKQLLEDAAVREMELLQELDRERTAEVEKEMERQRQLDIEHAKTRELRHSLEMERERQTQRELQRELEHYESGIRSSRREFPSTGPPSRSRERYRERENGRSVHEGTARSSSGSLQPEASTSSSMTMTPTVVLSGSRSYTNHPPTILQSRDRADDCGSNYEENFDGSKDSGDTSSIGDPDLVSVFDGQSSLYGSGQRHGSRGSKSRQAAERRERDGRREGKWERKH